MCPDRQIISLYFDGELPSPWKEKMKTHLSDCSQCQAVLSGYRNFGESFGELPAETVEAAQERVWKKLAAPELVVTETPAEEKAIYRRPMKRIWNRSVTLPLPAAAAAAAFIIVAFIALMGIRGGSQTIPQNSIAVMDIGLDDYATVPIQDMNDVLRYLNSQENGDIMVIRLPESRNFSRSGEPALINAADYSRTRRNFSR